jgi:hypothetical protein
LLLEPSLMWMRFQLFFFLFLFLCSCFYACDFVEPHLPARPMHLFEASYNTFIMIQIFAPYGQKKVMFKYNLYCCRLWNCDLKWCENGCGFGFLFPRMNANHSLLFCIMLALCVAMEVMTTDV